MATLQKLTKSKSLGSKGRKAVPTRALEIPREAAPVEDQPKISGWPLTVSPPEDSAWSQSIVVKDPTLYPLQDLRGLRRAAHWLELPVKPCRRSGLSTRSALHAALRQHVKGLIGVTNESTAKARVKAVKLPPIFDEAALQLFAERGWHVQDEILSLSLLDPSQREFIDSNFRYVRPGFNVDNDTYTVRFRLCKPAADTNTVEIVPLTESEDIARALRQLCARRKLTRLFIVEKRRGSICSMPYTSKLRGYSPSIPLKAEDLDMAAILTPPVDEKNRFGGVDRVLVLDYIAPCFLKGNSYRDLNFIGRNIALSMDLTTEGKSTLFINFNQPLAMIVNTTTLRNLSNKNVIWDIFGDECRTARSFRNLVINGCRALGKDRESLIEGLMSFQDVTLSEDGEFAAAPIPGERIGFTSERFTKLAQFQSKPPLICSSEQMISIYLKRIQGTLLQTKRAVDKEKDAIESKLYEVARRSAAINFQIESARERGIRVVTDQVNQLRSNPDVVELSTTPQGFELTTRPFTFTSRRSGVSRFLGKYRLNVNMLSGRVTLQNLMQGKANQPVVTTHYHDSLDDNAVCLGSYKGLLINAIASMDIYTFVLSILEFLKDAHLSDSLGSSNFKLFPLVEPVKPIEGRVIQLFAGTTVEVDTREGSGRLAADVIYRPGASAEQLAAEALEFSNREAESVAEANDDDEEDDYD